MSTSPARPLRVLTLLTPRSMPAFLPPLNAGLAAAGIAADLSADHAPETVDCIVLEPAAAPADFGPFIRARAVLSLWAGVERIVGNPTLTQPLARMVDPGIVQGMTEYVVGQVLRHHLGLDRYIGPCRGWVQDPAPLAPDRRVTVLGLGELGARAAQALAALGFTVSGWSRTPKAVPGLARCLHGDAGLDAALAGAEIIVTLLPRTPATENILNARTLSLPARGAAVINPGRGALIDDDALLAALESGQVGQATLDVFRVEPLPDDHPFRSHPKVTVTPHISAVTRPATAVGVVVENIRRLVAGEPLLHLVDRIRGY